MCPAGNSSSQQNTDAVLFLRCCVVACERQRRPEVGSSLCALSHVARSAGVGRTGTFIVIDGMIDMMHAEQKVDVFGFVSKIREQRSQLIQTDVSPWRRRNGSAVQLICTFIATLQNETISQARPQLLTPVSVLKPPVGPTVWVGG